MAPPHAAYLPYADTETDAWRPAPLPDLSGVDVVYLDTETTGLHRFKDRPVGLAVGYGDQALYAPFGHRGGGPQLDEAVVKRWAVTELRGKTIVNLNTKFDLHLMESWGVPLREMGCRFRDVAHSEALLDDHETSFSLNALAQKRLGTSKRDMTGAAIPDLPSNAVADYAMQDVRLVAQLHRHYAPLLAKEDLGRVQALEDQIIPVSVEMERNGMPLDTDRLDAMCERARVLWETLTWDLQRLVGFLVNPDSNEHMTRLWRVCGEPIAHWTETGKPSFTTDVVQDAATRHPAIELLWRIGKLEDLRSKYLDKFRREHEGGVLYPTLHQLKTGDGGTISGRFSCVRPNMQQVMGKNKHKRFYGWLAEHGEPFFIKDLFVAPAGRRWVSADMKQCEYRIAVDYTQSPRLLERYRQDPLTNFHAMVKEMLVPVRPDIDDTQVKVYNFLSIFGGGPSAASLNLGISYEDACLLGDDYKRMFPEMGHLAKKVEGVANARGDVKTRLGRRSRFKGRPGNRERVHKALNAIVQGTAADANKLTLIAVYERRRELDLTMRMTVHDSLEADQAPDREKLAAYEGLLNEQRLSLSVPLLWDVKTGDRWGACG